MTFLFEKTKQKHKFSLYNKTTISKIKFANFLNYLFFILQIFTWMMVNIRDGSVIYGSNAETLQKLRTFKDGKLKISSDGLLLHDQDGIAVSGDVRNSWIGISTLQALFIKEHNAVCDTLKVNGTLWHTHKKKCRSINSFWDFISHSVWTLITSFQVTSWT